MKYFNNIRKEILEFLSKGSNKILELGCGYGNTLSYLKKEGYASKVIGIDLNKEAEFKKLGDVDQIYIGDLETIKIDFSNQLFDYIIMNDVLEHLRNPDRMLNKFSAYLVENGALIISMPTIRNWRVLFNLIFKADFSYEEAGIMDRTHLRFFTFKSMIRLFNDCGLYLDKYKINYDNHIFAKILKLIPFTREFAAVQYLFKLKVHCNINRSKKL